MNIGAIIICATPRSGSTLLCDLLAGSGVAGRPHSWYRPESMAAFAGSFRVSVAGGTEGALFDRAYLAAVLNAGRAGTGIFGLRLMWDAVAGLSARLDRLFPGLATDAARFERAFGKPLYLYLSREDKVAQAVSRLRAEQTGLWHRNADGSERERAGAPRPAAYDRDRLRDYIDEVENDEVAWSRWFAVQRIAPIRLTYEQLAGDPQSVRDRVLLALGLDPSRAAAAEVRTSRMADAESLDWAARYRAGPALSEPEAE